MVWLGKKYGLAAQGIVDLDGSMYVGPDPPALPPLPLLPFLPYPPGNRYAHQGGIFLD